MAREAKQAGGDVCTLGELIHNSQVCGDLAEKGIGICESIGDTDGKKVVIRSHGISRQYMEALISSGCHIVDATCPYVRRAQELVASLAGSPVLILGDPDHPEVRGMLSYGDTETRVIRPGEDPGDMTWKKLSIVSQTTQKVSSLNDLVAKVLPRTLELCVHNTICSATTMRQTAAVDLARQSDLIVVIGGKHSSNTRMLHELCSHETRSVHIETAEELNPDMLEDAEKIGLTAGASTPEQTILDVFNRIYEIKGVPTSAKSIGEIPTYKEESC
jgi:(E)-4-hydroxy-3-methyl-but-2-enyl pyrophosphate reductase